MLSENCWKRSIFQCDLSEDGYALQKPVRPDKTCPDSLVPQTCGAGFGGVGHLRISAEIFGEHTDQSEELPGVIREDFVSCLLPKSLSSGTSDSS